MDFKKETKKLLESLSEQGFTQVKIAKLLGYGGKSISQIQNKGGTESLYNAIFLFSDYVRLKKSNNEQIDIIGQDNKSGAQDVNLDRQEKSFSSVLKSIAEAQQELADRLKNLSAAAESVSSEELDRIFQEIIAPEKSSAEKTDKRGRSSDKP